MKEAAAECTRLGHSMLNWVVDKKTYRARCQKCDALCLVSPRSMHNVRMRGEAVLFRCRSSAKPTK